MERRGGPRRSGSVADVAGAALPSPIQRVDSYRPRDVLQCLFAEIDEVRVDLAAHVVVCRARNQHAARLADTFEPRRDIDASPKMSSPSISTSPRLTPIR